MASVTNSLIRGANAVGEAFSKVSEGLSSLSGTVKSFSMPRIFNTDLSKNSVNGTVGAGSRPASNRNFEELGRSSTFSLSRVLQNIVLDLGILKFGRDAEY